jgi:sulfonate transport system substrate-binding protein
MITGKFTQTIRARIGLFISVLVLLVLTACGAATSTTSGKAAQDQTNVRELRIGYQRGGVQTLVKARGDLEKRFGSSVKITWLLFPAGPQLLEAMNTGTVDIGATGDTPPIFAQAAGTPLLYVASSVGSGIGSAVIAPENSQIKTVADLKGKKVAFQKASASHLLIVRALEQVGLKYEDIQPVFLAPADARAAFQGGSINAWVIWDPFLTAAKQELNAKVVVAGEDVSPTRAFYLAHEKFVKENPDLIQGFIDELQKATEWTKTHRDEYAELLANETGIDVKVWQASVQNSIADLVFMDDAAIDYQQNVADMFYNLKLIPNKLNIKASVWIPSEVAQK